MDGSDRQVSGRGMKIDGRGGEKKWKEEKIDQVGKKKGGGRSGNEKKGGLRIVS